MFVYVVRFASELLKSFACQFHVLCVIMKRVFLGKTSQLYIDYYASMCVFNTCVSKQNFIPTTDVHIKLHFPSQPGVSNEFFLFL